MEFIIKISLSLIFLTTLLGCGEDSSVTVGVQETKDGHKVYGETHYGENSSRVDTTINDTTIERAKEQANNAAKAGRNQLETWTNKMDKYLKNRGVPMDKYEGDPKPNK